MKVGYVSIVGKPNVGKSSLLNDIFSRKVSIVTKKAQTTRNAISNIFNDEDSQIIFVDTPGIHNFNASINRFMNKASYNSIRGADVTVFARKQRDFADAFTKSITPKDFKELSTDYQYFDALINTVPRRVLGEKELDNINPDCVLIEIASAPFGIDFQSAKEKAFNVIKAGSLPGKVAPESAGEIIGRSILPIIRARGSTD